MVRQFGQARGDIYKSQAERHVTVEDKDRFTIAGPDQKVRFSCGTYLIDNGRKIDSYLCLTVEWQVRQVPAERAQRPRQHSGGEAICQFMDRAVVALGGLSRPR